MIIGPYVRKGKSRILVEVCTHELTNDCLIPFGILDLKTKQPYFYNFINKPTSKAIRVCYNILSKSSIMFDNRIQSRLKIKYFILLFK